MPIVPISAFHTPDGKNEDHNYTSCRFDHESVWGGQILNWDYWQDVISMVGEMDLKKYNFRNTLFSETPLVITQNSLPYNQKKDQIQKMYELLFEEYKCPYLLICPQALLSLLSHNLSSGIVVDFGESSTSFTCINNGHTQYDNCLTSTFMSGRNLTALQAIYKNNLKLGLTKDKAKESMTLTYEELLLTQFEKENQSELSWLNPDSKIEDRDKYEARVSTFSYLYNYPEVFRINLNNKYSKQPFLDNLEDKINFIVKIISKYFRVVVKIGKC